MFTLFTFTVPYRDDHQLLDSRKCCGMVMQTIIVIMPSKNEKRKCLVVQALFDLQLSSIKHYNIASFVPDVKVHYIVHRYGQLTASLLSLNADYQVLSPSLRKPCSISAALM